MAQLIGITKDQDRVRVVRVLHQLGIFPFFGRMESPSPISKHEERSKFNEREAEKIFFIPLFTK